MARRGRKPKRRLGFSLKGSTLRSLLAIFLIIVGVVSLLALFADVSNSGGKAGSSLKLFLNEYFGLFSAFMSLILIYLAVLLLINRKSKVFNYRVLVGLMMFFVGLLGMFGSTAGSLGLALQSLLAVFVSVPGAVFLYFVLVIASILVISNTGVGRVVEKFGAFFSLIHSKFFDFGKGDEVNLDADKGEKNAKDDQQVEMELLESVDTDFRSNDHEDQDYQDVDFEIPDASEDANHAKDSIDKSFEILSPPNSPVLQELSNGDNYENALDSESTSDVISTSGGANSLSVGSTGENIVGGQNSTSPKLPFSNKVWEYPPISLLNNEPNRRANAGNTSERSRIIEETLKAFGVKAHVADMNIGPAVTQYAVSPAIGTKTSKIQNLSTDLALRLKSPSGSVRIEAPIPGTNLIGIEVPNFSPSTVSLRSVLESEPMKRVKSKLAVPMGHDVSGKPVVQDMAKWPHGLIAGATGSGKSVMLNALICALLYRCSPQELRFIMIDPKMVELVQYNGIPHLLTPVVTEVEQKAVSTFAWAVNEMERRYKAFSAAGVRNIESYNQLSGFQAEPYIVIVVDELAEMMMTAASEVEKYITRISQKSRATGIHLILATQRPTVNILTGTIKANAPTRIAFKVSSQIDSRVIIDQSGAETLIGRGDMLFIPPDDSKPKRVQGVFVSDKEINALVEFLKNSGVEPDYKSEITEMKVATNKAEGSVDGVDEKMVEALEIIMETNKASASYLQRRLGIGYTRAARIIDDLEAAGVIGSAQGSKPRDVLVPGVDSALERLKPQSQAAQDED